MFNSPDLFNEPIKKPISIGLRLGTMLLDHALICFLIGVPIIVLSKIFEPTNQVNSTFETIPSYYFIPLFAVYFCKDCIDGRSLAKRILKLQVINRKDGLAASPVQCLIRNLFILIWPIEVLVAFFNQEKRIGDIVAGTKIGYYNPTAEDQRTNIFQVILCFILASALSFLLFIFF